MLLENKKETLVLESLLHSNNGHSARLKRNVGRQPKHLPRFETSDILKEPATKLYRVDGPGASCTATPNNVKNDKIARPKVPTQLTP